jgi:NADH-quinone oxidoreductase subunit L
MLDLVWLIPALPLAGFLVLVVAGRRLGDPWAGWFATAMVGGSFVASIIVFTGLVDRPADQRQFTQVLFTWIPALKVDVGFLVDPLAITMALFVTGVGSLIHLYSVGYMHGDPGYSKFFLYLNLFAFSMLMLVLGDNLLVTFLGWEGVGACSYLLIAFWFDKGANASAGKKAFVTNRVGDWGFMVATFLTFSAIGTLTYAGEHGVLEQATAGGLTATTATAIAVLLFVGACGKSAQLPLYVWLPDAMAGPTPVSALIHAATMVTAGVYLMVRVSPLLALSYDWLPWLIAIVGAATALFAATIAVAQNDIKRVLAYSTISQLGYMFLAVGSGAYVAAIFHMVTHAFFKALLFLGSGSVIHGLHDEQDMRRMGALRTLMPITAFTFIIGWLAIAGIPPFAGFWSKDDILINAWEKSPALWLVGFVTAGLTAYYMSRQVFMVFFGEARWEEHRAQPAEHADEHADEHGHAVRPHESPWTMTFPLVVLAGLSVFGGAINLPFGDLDFLHKWLEPVFEGSDLHELTSSTGLKVVLLVATTVLCVVGIWAARRVYLEHRVDTAKVEPELLARGWRVDETYTAIAGGPGREAFTFMADVVDAKGIDGAVNGVAASVRASGGRLRRLQTGYVRNYAAGVAIGAVVLVALFLSRAGF